MGLINSFMGYVAIAGIGCGVAVGWKVRDWQCDAAYAKTLERSQRDRKILQEKINAISSTYEKERDQADLVVTETRTKIREIYKTRPATSSDCIPDSRVVGLLESGLSDANRAAAGKSRE